MSQLRSFSLCFVLIVFLKKQAYLPIIVYLSNAEALTKKYLLGGEVVVVVRVGGGLKHL